MIRTRAGILPVFLAWAFGAWGQTAPDMWWVRFTDKASTPYSVDAPWEFLSPRALHRRAVQGIAVDDLDLPVDPAYISTILGLGDVQLHNKSKWFNAITVRTSDPGVIESIAALPFVMGLKRVEHHWVREVPIKSPVPPSSPMARDADHGGSFAQIAMLNGHLLHALDARGQGLLIGVLDSGFEGPDHLPAFEALRDRGGIVLVRDLAEPGGNVYEAHWHGRSVLSCMAGIVPGELSGTAPMADFVLLRTEDVGSEYRVEEDNWVSGAELCDSIGVDIINTSLGYTVFQDSTQDHVYADMDGATTRISIAAGIASRKGMIPVTSAGNLGNSEWYHISAPADALDILAVGAVDEEGWHASFSSHGPSADGRVKPDVAAMGQGTIGIGPDGEVSALSGTSFSSPLVAGLAACLWQLHPDRTATEIMDAIRRSSSRYTTPDEQLGHGIPDFMLAHHLLDGLLTGTVDHGGTTVPVYPMPFTDRLHVGLTASASSRPVLAELHDMAGRPRWSRTVTGTEGGILLEGNGLSLLAAGAYLLRVDGRPVQVVIRSP